MKAILNHGIIELGEILEIVFTNELMANAETEY